MAIQELNTIISSAVAAALQQQSAQNGDSDGSSDSKEELNQETLLDKEQVLTGPEVSPALAAMVQKCIKEPTPLEVTKAERYKTTPKNVASTLEKMWRYIDLCLLMQRLMTRGTFDIKFASVHGLVLLCVHLHI